VKGSLQAAPSGVRAAGARPAAHSCSKLITQSMRAPVLRELLDQTKYFHTKNPPHKARSAPLPCSFPEPLRRPRR
jgi:hypothetical protein